jgi:hypothetical protein
MNMNAPISAERAAELSREIEVYCLQHPRSPAAVRRPRVCMRGAACIAVLGEDMQSGIVGIGSTVDAALRAFDIQYANALRPPRA